MIRFFLVIACLCGVAGCATGPVDGYPTHGADGGPEIVGSLFASDQAVMSDAAVQQALDGVVSMPENARIALLDLSPETQAVRHYGWYYWRSEDYMDQQAQYFDALSTPLVTLPGVRRVVPMPSFTVTKEMTLSQIREAAVRLQIDLLVIYSLRSDIFYKWRFLSANEVRGYATCELALFDTRTGIMPYTSIVTHKEVVMQKSSQEGLAETEMRAEVAASEICLKKIAAGTADFVGRGGRHGQ
ncbi:MAG: hypothetical protein P1U64_09055 [Alcanivoracaceae bacterium]|nr:hypothetical protein [Alcanivoracaceae bacterium]